MAEIVQKFTFDAASAIATLNELDGSIKRINRRLLDFNKRTAAGTSKLGDDFDGVAASAGKADTALGKTTKNFKKTGQAGKKAGTSITVSWQTMIRVVQTQVIVRALNELIKSFGASAEAAGEFQLAVGRIEAIAKGTGSSTDELTSSLRNMAKEIGRPIADVAAASYEALQNDLGSTAETMDLVATSAHNLALVTGSDLVDSVNAISSVLKIFELDISEGERVASVLFGTIDAGRVTLDDLASSLGGVGPIAKQLGVSFEEMSAAIAGITLQGVDSAKAQTQLKGVFTALLKPTNALAAAYKELGVESGQELIQTTGGLVQALQALEGVAGDNAQQFASFFGRIRAQSGALNILSDDAKDTTRIMGELKDATNRVTVEGEKLDNLDIRKYQRGIADTTDLMVELGGTTLKLRVITRDFLNDVGVGVGILLGAFQGAQHGAEETARAIIDSQKKIDASRKKSDAEAKKLLKSQLDGQSEEITKFAEKVSKIYKGLSKEVVNAQKDIGNGISLTAEKFADGIKSIIDQVASRIKGLQGLIDGFTQDSASSLRDVADLEFEFGLDGLNEAQKFQKRLNKLVQEEKELRQAASEVTGDPATQEKFAREVADVLKAANKAVSAAQRTDNEANVREAKKAQIQATKDVAKAQREAAKSVADFQAGIDDKRQAKLTNGLAEIAKKGQELANEDPDSDAAKNLRQEINALKKELDSSLVNDLGLGDALNKSLKDFQTSINTASFEWNGAVQALQDAIGAETFQANVDFKATGNADLDAGLQDATLDTPNVGDALGKRNELIKEFIVDQEQANRKVRDGATDANALLDVFNNTVSAVQGFQNIGLSEALLGDPEALIASVDLITDKLNEAKSEILDGASPEDTAAQLAGIQEGIQQLEASGDLNRAQAEALGSAAESLKAFAVSLEQLGEDRKVLDPAALENAKLQLDSMERAAAEANRQMESIKTAADGTATSTQQASTSMGTLSTNAGAANQQAGALNSTTNAGVSLANSLASAWASVAAQARAAAAASRDAAAAQSAGSVNANHGARIAHRADGGGTRGSDTVPAMLSPGEFVINAKSARKFSGQIQALNSGQRPLFRDQGGSVTNIGDVNVNVSSEGGSSEQQGRSIANSLRRELRRKTSTL